MFERVPSITFDSKCLCEAATCFVIPDQPLLIPGYNKYPSSLSFFYLSPRERQHWLTDQRPSSASSRSTRIAPSQHKPSARCLVARPQSPTESRIMMAIIHFIYWIFKRISFAFDEIQDDDVLSVPHGPKWAGKSFSNEFVQPRRCDEEEKNA